MKFFSSSIVLLFFSQYVLAQTQITYTYDELGRVKTVTDSINSNRSYEYDAAGNRSGVSIAGSNLSPQATSDNVTAILFTPTQFNLTANDTDPNGDPLTITSVTQPGNASVTIKSASSVEIVGTASRTNSTFNYVISDGKGGQATGTVAVTVN